MAVLMEPSPAINNMYRCAVDVATEWVTVEEECGCWYRGNIGVGITSK